MIFMTWEGLRMEEFVLLPLVGNMTREAGEEMAV